MSLTDRLDPRAADPRRPTAAEWLAAPTSAGDLDLVVMGVPRFAGSTAPSSAHATPAAVRRALAALTTWAPSRGVDVARLRAVDRGDVTEPDGEEGEWRVRMAAATAAEARLVVALGGDGSVTPPLVDGVCGARIAETGVVLVGPQLDLRAGRTSASAARWLLELGVPPQRLVQVGLGDWSDAQGYDGEAASLGLRRFGADVVRRRGAAAVMADALDLAAGAGGPVCVHLDLAVTDQASVPGCRRALPGGLSAAAVRELAHAAGADPRVGAVSIVEVDPALDPDGRTVRLAALCLLEVAAGLAGRDQQT